MGLFDGIWRPDPQHPDRPPDELELVDGMYACLSAEPPYRVPADGQAHPVEGQGSFDTLAITIPDQRTVRRVATLDGNVVLEATAVVSPDGTEKTELQRLPGMGPGPGVVVSIRSMRLGTVAPAERHAICGRWKVVEFDLPNHEEDTEYRIVDGVLSMHDGFGRSFEAPLDGTSVPYVGDTRFASVSVRWIDEATIEEVDRDADGAVFLTTQWHVDPDRRTMHVRFEYASGLVQEQAGQRIAR